MIFMDSSSRRWYLRHIVLWLVLAGVVCWWRGPAFRRAFEPEFYPPGHKLFVPDFFQEWASARNRFYGLPIYTPQEITLQLYLGVQRPPNDPAFIGLNAHPPASVLLCLPFAGLKFADAFALWNVLSLAFLAASAGLIVRQLDLPFSLWDLLPAITFLLLCHPFWHQMVHGQLNLLLLLLLTGVWVADRNSHPRWAGTLLGLATAIKFFPGFLFVYFVLRRDWPAVRGVARSRGGRGTYRRGARSRSLSQLFPGGAAANGIVAERLAQPIPVRCMVQTVRSPQAVADGRDSPADLEFGVGVDGHDVQRGGVNGRTVPGRTPPAFSEGCGPGFRPMPHRHAVGQPDCLGSLFTAVGAAGDGAVAAFAALWDGPRSVDIVAGGARGADGVGR